MQARKVLKLVVRENSFSQSYTISLTLFTVFLYSINASNTCHIQYAAIASQFTGNVKNNDKVKDNASAPNRIVTPRFL